MKNIILLFLLVSMTIGNGYAQDMPEIRHNQLSYDFSTAQPEMIRDGAVFTGEGLVPAAGYSYGIFISKAIEIPLKDADPFLGIGVRYRLEGSVNDVDISVSVSRDGYEWDEFFPVEYDEDIVLEDGYLASSIMVFDKEAAFLRYRIDFRNASAERVVVKELSVSFISPGKTPEGITAGTQSIGGTNPESPADFPKPPVVSRTDWGCPDGQGSRWSPSYTTVTHLIVHHTATANTSSDWPAVVRMIWQWHAIDNGWGDIGYNFLIDPEGVIYEGRSGGDGAIGAHFCGTNSKTMGLSMIGTYSNIMPTNDAISSVHDLLVWKCNQISLDPLGSSYHSPSGRTLNHISGHRDGCATACPGQTLYSFLPTLRTDIQNTLSGVAPSVVTQSINNGAQNIKAYSSIALTFSMQMDTATFINAVTTVPSASFTVHWTDEYTVEITPDPFWDFSTTYTVTIDSNARNLYGAPLDGDGDGEPGGNFVLTFSTTAPDNQPPLILGVYPEVEGVSVKTGIAVKFDEPAINYDDKVALFDDQNNQITLTGIELLERDSKRLLVCEPASDLLPGTNYTLKILPGITDPFGNSIDTERIYPFTTETGSFTKGAVLDKFSSTAIWYQPKDNDGSVKIDTNATAFYMTYGKVISGPTSAVVSYAFTENNGGIVNFERLEMLETGNLIGLWVYGDYSLNMLEFVFANPGEYITEAALLDFYGWRFIAVDAASIPGSDKQFKGLRIKQLAMGDRSGILYFDDLQKDAVTSTDEEDGMPETFSLSQNYPNPFNPVTTISYTLPEAADVKLTIYNALGEEAAIIVNAYQQSGSYRVSFDAADLPSGVYFYRIQAGEFVESKKMMLLK